MKLINAKKNYKTKSQEIKALDNINVEFGNGNFYAIMGHSGSGKTTLIQILGLLDNLTSGEYFINNTNTNLLNDKEKAYLRMKKIGFVFQSFHLDPKLKAYENVMLPMLINNNIPRKERKSKAIKLLQQFNLSDRINHFPHELSGGEQQRVAIARALANDPEIILADEPTGNLDVDNEKHIFELLKQISKNNKCVVVVSHNSIIKKYADVVYVMENGKIKGVN